MSLVRSGRRRGPGNCSRNGVREGIRPLPSLGFIPTPPEEQGSCTGCVPAPLAPSWNILPPAAAFGPFHTGADYPLTEVPGPRVKADLTADLTDFCPFKSPGEAPGSVFSPSLHISRASLHPPLPLPWQPPAQHPPCARLPKICPRAAPQGSGLASALQQSLCSSSPGERGRSGGGAGGPSTPAPWKWAIPGARWEMGEQGKEAARGMSWRRPGGVCVSHRVRVWPPRSPHARMQRSLSQGNWGTSSVRVPPSDLQPWLSWHHHSSPPAGHPHS